MEWAEEAMREAKEARSSHDIVEWDRGLLPRKPKLTGTTCNHTSLLQEGVHYVLTNLKRTRIMISLTRWTQSLVGLPPSDSPQCRHDFLDIKPPPKSDNESSDGDENIPHATWIYIKRRKDDENPLLRRLAKGLRRLSSQWAARGKNTP